MDQKYEISSYVYRYSLIMFLLIYAFVIPEIVALPTSCLFKLLTGVPCPSCNISHAVLAVLHLDFAEAFYLNPLVFLLPVVAVILLVERFYKKKRIIMLLISIFILVTILISYSTRLIIYFPDEPMSYFWGSLLGRLIKFFKK